MLKKLTGIHQAPSNGRNHPLLAVSGIQNHGEWMLTLPSQPCGLALLTGVSTSPFLRTIIQKMARELLGTESLLLLAYQLVQFGSELELVSMHNNNANLSCLYSQSWR